MMKRKTTITALAAVLAAVSISSCSYEEMPCNLSDGPKEMTFTISHPSQTRATDSGFESGDAVGVFVTDASAELEIAGNTLNNERLLLSGSDWKPSKPLYWDEGIYDIVAYYPYLDAISSVTELPFEVKTDQNTESPTGPGGYEASDFLYAAVRGTEASDNPVNLQFHHIMSRLTIRLVKGEDFSGELPETATVRIHNTVTAAEIDLRNGIATKSPTATVKSITAKQSGAKTYTAILVPQRIDNRVPLIEIEFGNNSYLFESRFQFKAGMHHIVNLVIDSNSTQMQIEIAGGIAPWT